MDDIVSYKVTGDIGEDTNEITSGYIRNKHIKLDIGIQQRSSKKCTTVVQGIPEDIDLNIILKAWKKV